MTKVAITQPYLFPYIGYFQIMNAVDEYVIYDDVQYIMRGWINRNNLLINGEKKLFTIPLHGASPNKLINEIEIADDFVKFKKTITAAYARAPYFRDVSALIDNICSYEDNNLARFVGNSLAEIARYLGIRSNHIYSSDIQKEPGLKGQDKIIAICKKLGAVQYINAIGGQELYDKGEFQKAGIDLKFLETRFINYDQFDNEFIPGLSMIDVMMFNSPETIAKMLDAYELI